MWIDAEKGSVLMSRQILLTGQGTTSYINKVNSLPTHIFRDSEVNRLVTIYHTRPKHNAGAAHQNDISKMIKMEVLHFPHNT